MGTVHDSGEGDFTPVTSSGDLTWVVRTGPDGNGGKGLFPLPLVKDVGRGDFGPPFSEGDLDFFGSLAGVLSTWVPDFASMGSGVDFLGFNHIFPSVLVIFSLSGLGEGLGWGAAGGGFAIRLY